MATRTGRHVTRPHFCVSIVTLRADHLRHEFKRNFLGGLADRDQFVGGVGELTATGGVGAGFEKLHTSSQVPV
jgi:hypothetical protein